MTDGQTAQAQGGEWQPDDDLAIVNLTRGGTPHPASRNGDRRAVIDGDTGEILHECATCYENEIQRKGAERDVRAWRKRYHELERRLDPEGSARKHPLYEDIRALFELWQAECDHPRSKFTADRFRLALPLFDSYGEETCVLAIRGAAYDPFTQQRRNGSTKRFDDWDLIFRSSDKLEEFANRAPPTQPR